MRVMAVDISLPSDMYYATLSGGTCCRVIVLTLQLFKCCMELNFFTEITGAT